MNGTNKSNKTHCNNHDLHGSPVIPDDESQFDYLQNLSKMYLKKKALYKADTVLPWESVR